MVMGALGAFVVAWKIGFEALPTRECLLVCVRHVFSTFLVYASICVDICIAVYAIAIYSYL